MEDRALFKRIVYEFAKTIDDALLPQTTISTLGLKMASQLQWRVKKTLEAEKGQSKHALFISTVSKALFTEFEYALTPELIEKDRLRFKVKQCPFKEGSSLSLCSFMSGIMGGLGFLTFGYSKVVSISGPEQSPNPCCFDMYIAPTPEAEKAVGIEYSKNAISLLKGEDEGYIDSQRQARRKLILGLFSNLAFSLRDDPSTKHLIQKYIESLSCIPEIRLAALYLKNEDSDSFVLKAHYGIPKEILPSIDVIEGHDEEDSAKNPLTSVETFDGQRLTIAKAVAARSFASIKIEAKRNVIGVLNIGWKSTFPVSSETIEALKASCTLLATAIESRQLYFQLEKTYIDNISILNHLINTIDQFSDDHAQRVAELAKGIAEEMNLPQDDVVLVYEAGRIHDIGKINIPAHILNKPDRLTDEEFEIVKQHPLTGAKLLAPVDNLRKVIPAVKYHHERLDGSGYPEGLTGEQIPLHARILAVADVYDAMAHKRPHREAIDDLHIVQEIINGSGTKYDAAVVGALVAIINSKDLEDLQEDLLEERQSF